ncbi:MAG: phosphotransferase [Proteobacteria bacterium]|nr:phosphotransferase [Pseudomonadota bacterium]
MTDQVDAFLATMVASSRPVSVEYALTLVQEHYGIAARATRLTGERDENFRLTAAGGAEYVLKIANAAEDPAETEFQNEALLHIERSDDALPCPRVVRDRAGKTFIRFTDEAGATRTARILTFLAGRLLGSSTRSPAQRAACGRIGGKLSLALRGFDHPAARRTILWDVRHTAHMRTLLEEMPRFPLASPVRALLEHVVPRIERELPTLRHQVVHCDLNALNILVDPADEARVAGVIDFGDMVHTALVADVAVCAAELIPMDCSDPSEARASILDVSRAYHDCVALHQEEVGLLGALVAARLLMTLVIHEWHVQRNPGGGHFAPLEEGFMRARLKISDQLLLQELRL